MRSGTRLQSVDEAEEAVEEAAPRIAPRIEPALLSLLITNLKVLSQRSIVALASLVDLALIGSAFALWLLIIANPTTPQLIGVAGYALFILTCLFLRRHR